MATPTAYQRVVSASNYDASAGPIFIRMDGVDDALASATFAAGTLTSSMDCLIAVRLDSTANVMLARSSVAPYGFFGVAESGGGSSTATSSGSPQYKVNGVAVPGGTSVTRAQLYSSLKFGEWMIIDVIGLDLSAWTNFSVGAVFSGYNLNGALGGIMLFASGQDANRDKARAEMAAYFGVTLP